MNENEFEYNGKTYIAINAPMAGNCCQECAFSPASCMQLLDSTKIPPCTRTGRMDNRSVIFIEKKLTSYRYYPKEKKLLKLFNDGSSEVMMDEKAKINKPLKNNNMKNYIEKVKSLIVPSINNDFVFTMDGKLGLKNNEKIISYDKNTKEFTEYPENFGFEIPVYEMSVAAKEIKEGDIIKHNNSWVIVKSTKDNSISVLSFTGTSKNVQVVKNFLLNQTMVRKLIVFDFNNNSNMNPMMLMLLLKEGENNNDLLQTMLIMQMMQGNQQVNTQQNGFNPIMLLMMDKSTDVKDLLMMQMMSGQQLFAQNNIVPDTKKK